MKKGFFAVLVMLGIFSYGFIDPNLAPSSLTTLVYQNRPAAAGIFFIILCLLCLGYIYFLRNAEKLFASWQKISVFLIGVSAVLVVSYPALSYDLFNYITTAKVAFTYHENPYVVMPVEIPNEPYLAFTRASNKLALYGPVWLLFTALPHALGGNNIWQTIIAFKLMNAIAYIGFSYLIYRMTKNMTNVVFFALNPLVLIEVLMNGHNDIYMIVLALVGLRYKNAIAFVASWFIKGATVILTPLMVLRISWEKTLVTAYWVLAFVFFVFAPLREELYPWYAVWLVMTAALMPLKSHRFIVGFTVVLSFALELRNLPYMWSGSYAGWGPSLRLVLTVVPIVFYFVIYGIVRMKKKHQ